ncbi:MAG: hypothetical protein KGJ20_03980, partial [Gammaproteobacteria bacterium]|nr:hypothetical protein [Gammaproteobacteria bacterium]
SSFYAWRFSERHAERLAAEQNVAKVAPAAAVPSAATTIPAKSVAVLPFVNESDDKNQQYFSDGLSEDLITALSQFAGLKVISRDSSFQFRNSAESSARIGEKLGVAHLLEGSVQRAGNEVRINAELVNATDGSTLWSQRYDRPYKDLFALQDDITHSVADALQAKLLTAPGAVVQSDRPPSGNLAAYNAYLQGNAYDALQTEADTRKAIAFYTRAVELDPRFARAYAGLSSEWTDLASRFLGGAPARQANAKARAAVDTALKLAPDLAAAHTAHGWLLLNAKFDWYGSETEFRRALQLAPNDSIAKYNLGRVLATLGQLPQAINLTRKALTTDPLAAGDYDFLSQYLVTLGRFDEGEQAIRLAIALRPEAAEFHQQLAIIEVLRGDAAAALAAAQQEPAGPWREVAMALALQIGTDRTAADTALKILIDKEAGGSAYQIAEVYAVRRDPDNTFKWLDRAWVNRDAGIQQLRYDPLFLRYKDDPRFKAVLKKMGLPYTPKDLPVAAAN